VVLFNLDMCRFFLDFLSTLGSLVFSFWLALSWLAFFQKLYFHMVNVKIRK
jgi:hypothetical protein